MNNKDSTKHKKNGWYLEKRSHPSGVEKLVAVKYYNGKETRHKWLYEREEPLKGSLERDQNYTNRIVVKNTKFSRENYEKVSNQIDVRGIDTKKEKPTSKNKGKRRKSSTKTQKKVEESTQIREKSLSHSLSKTEQSFFNEIDRIISRRKKDRAKILSNSDAYDKISDLIKKRGFGFDNSYIFQDNESRCYFFEYMRKDVSEEQNLYKFRKKHVHFLITEITSAISNDLFNIKEFFSKPHVNSINNIKKIEDCFVFSKIYIGNKNEKRNNVSPFWDDEPLVDLFLFFNETFNKEPHFRLGPTYLRYSKKRPISFNEKLYFYDLEIIWRFMRSCSSSKIKQKDSKSMVFYESPFFLFIDPDKLGTITLDLMDEIEVNNIPEILLVFYKNYLLIMIPSKIFSFPIIHRELKESNNGLSSNVLYLSGFGWYETLEKEINFLKKFPRETLTKSYYSSIALSNSYPYYPMPYLQLIKYISAYDFRFNSLIPELSKTKILDIPEIYAEACINLWHSREILLSLKDIDFIQEDAFPYLVLPEEYEYFSDPMKLVDLAYSPLSKDIFHLFNTERPKDLFHIKAPVFNLRSSMTMYFFASEGDSMEIIPLYKDYFTKTLLGISYRSFKETQSDSANPLTNQITHLKTLRNLEFYSNQPTNQSEIDYHSEKYDKISLFALEDGFNYSKNDQDQEDNVKIEEIVFDLKMKKEFLNNVYLIDNSYERDMECKLTRIVYKHNHILIDKTSVDLFFKLIEKLYYSKANSPKFSVKRILRNTRFEAILGSKYSEFSEEELYDAILFINYKGITLVVASYSLYSRDISQDFVLVGENTLDTFPIANPLVKEMKILLSQKVSDVKKKNPICLRKLNRIRDYYLSMIYDKYSNSNSKD